MTCPNCGVELDCPCSNCQGYRKRNGKISTLLWEWVDGETMMCPVCGFSASADYWQDWEFNEYDKARGAYSEIDEKYLTEHLMPVIEEYRKSELSRLKQ